MDERTAAAVEPADFELAGGELFGTAAEIGPASLAPDCDQGGMFADEEEATTVVAVGAVHHQATLKKQRPVKNDHAQTKDLQRCGEGFRPGWFGLVHA